MEDLGGGQSESRVLERRACLRKRHPAQIGDVHLERGLLERVLRLADLLEVECGSTRQGAPHEVGPDRCSHRAAESATAADVEHGPLLLVEPDPHGGDQVGGVADEPSVAVVLAGARLAGHRATDIGHACGATGDHTAKHRGRFTSDLGLEHLVALGVDLEDDLAMPVDDASDGDWLVVYAVGCQRTVGRGHLERGDVLRAERDRRVGGDLRSDPHATGDGRDLLRARALVVVKLPDQSCEHRVNRGARRRVHRDEAAATTLAVGDLPEGLGRNPGW